MAGHAINHSSTPQEEILFSIIVPVYNTEDYVTSCLESALKQTECRLEVLVVDDGSTDGSALACAAIAARDTRVTLFRKENEGQGVARNFALSRARGRYVLFLDSDDMLESRACEILHSCFASDDIDVISFGIGFRTSTGQTVASRSVSRRKYGEAPDIFIDALLDRDFLSSPCNKAYNRTFLREHDILFPPLRAYEDTLFSRHVAYCVRKVLYIPDMLYWATTRPASTTRSMSARNIRIATDLFARERALFAQRLAQAPVEIAFGAHVVRFIAHLLLLSAFRVDDPLERRECWRLADATGFNRLARRREVMKHLSVRTKVQVAVARRPFLARLAAQAAKWLKVTPY